jgi:predicted RNA-binding Zn-ribbon protein involved in translation (DUF1610 family)
MEGQCQSGGEALQEKRLRCCSLVLALRCRGRNVGRVRRAGKRDSPPHLYFGTVRAYYSHQQTERRECKRPREWAKMRLGNWRHKNEHQKFLTPCVSCGAKTSIKYAREHHGECKSCITGIEQNLFTCPDCGEKRLTAFQKNHRYHCDICTRNVEQTGGVYGF